MTDWTVGDCTVAMIRGNLAEEPMDMISLGVGMDFLPNGPASGAIFGAAGDELQKEVGDNEVESPGDILVAGGHELPSDQIILCSLPNTSEVNDLEEFLLECYLRILEEASDREDVRSLSLAPLGTGDLDYSLKVASTTLIDAIQQLAGDSLRLDRLNIVVFETVQFYSVQNFVKQTLEGDREQGPKPEYY
ncbi:MAG: macro domain-containing protein [bacterium]